MIIKRRVRYVELDGERALNLEDAFNAGLLEEDYGVSLRCICLEGDLYIHQQDLIDNKLLRDFVGVEITGE